MLEANRGFESSMNSDLNKKSLNMLSHEDEGKTWKGLVLGQVQLGQVTFQVRLSIIRLSKVKFRKVQLGLDSQVMLSQVRKG